MVVFERSLSCPARDGTVLATDVYRPADGRHPVLLQRTPYDKAFFPFTWLTIDPVRMAEAGYAVAIQDVRGRFASGGEFRDIYVAESDDGEDAVAWAAQQPWSNGSVGMYGVSYMAGTSWLAAAQGPPALGALATAQAPGDLFADVRRGGALQLGLLATWSLTALGGDLVRRRLVAGQASPLDIVGLLDDVDALDTALEQLPLSPFAPLDKRAGGIAPWFSAFAGEEGPTERHAAMSVGDRYTQIQAPALQIAGWHDLLLAGDLAHHAAIRERAGTEEARERSRLIVGPWAHGAFGNVVGELDYGIRSNGIVMDLKGDLTSLHRRWFDQRLKGIDTGIDDEPRVQVLVMGENRWRGFDSWPPPAMETAWYPQPGGGLAPDTPDGEPSTFVLDPDNPVRTRGGTILMAQTYVRGAVEQAQTERHPDVLTFTSEPLRENLTVIGPVRLEAWVVPDGPDTDVVARLCDVDPDGRSYNVVDGIQRLSYRDGPPPRPATAGVPVAVTVDLWATAQVFKPGNRLRLQVCASDFPRYDRCPGTGETPGAATRIRAQRNQLLHDAAHPTRLLLPVVSA